MCVARHAEITQNDKFAISLQHLTKEVSDEVDFLRTDKHESLLEIDNSDFWAWSSIPKVPKMTSLQRPYNTSHKEIEMKLICGMQKNIKVDFNALGIKVSYKVILSVLMGMIKHSQSTQSNKFAIQLQYLTKEVRDGAHFRHADKGQSFYKLALSFLMEVARHVQSTQNRKLAISLQYNKKNVLQLLLCSCDAK